MVVCDRSTGPAIFALDDCLSVVLVLNAFKRPDTTAKTLSNTAALGGGLYHSQIYISVIVFVVY